MPLSASREAEFIGQRVSLCKWLSTPRRCQVLTRATFLFPVTENLTEEAQRRGGFVWAPGLRRFHWSTVERTHGKVENHQSVWPGLLSLHRIETYLRLRHAGAMTHESSPKWPYIWQLNASPCQKDSATSQKSVTSWGAYAAQDPNSGGSFRLAAIS